MLELTIPISYAPESDAEFESYKVQSLPVLSKSKPAMIQIPHNSVFFNISGHETAIANCRELGPFFSSCHVDDIDFTMTDCLYQLIHLKSEYEARKVKKIHIKLFFFI